MEKVKGIGGVFIKAKDVKSLASWYQKYLGIDFGNNSYVDFKWLNRNPDAPGHTVFSFFTEDTTYFNPAEKPFMINFRVKNLDELLGELEKEGVEIVGEKEEYVWKVWMDNGPGRKIK